WRLPRFSPLVPSPQMGRGSATSLRSVHAQRSTMPDPEITDEPADVVIEGREVLARGFRPYERVRARHADGDIETRDVLRAAAAVGVLPIDLTCGEGVLIRQFRLPAQLAHGKSELVEIVPGPVGGNQTRRESGRA